MKIKKFSARTFSEALAQVKSELSHEAVILSTEEKKGPRPQVVVTAAIDFETADGSVRSPEFGAGSTGIRLHSDPVHAARPEPVSDQRTPEAQRPALNAPLKTKSSELRTAAQEAPMQKADQNFTPHAPYKSYVTRDSGTDTLRAEISGLRALIESLKSNGYEMALPPKKRAVLRYLRDRSIREEYAFRLCEKTGEISDLPLLISSDIRVKRGDASRKAVLMIGPTGVGKTTTIAKLAARALQAGKKAAIINLDSFRIGAMEQARIYARILGIPLATASDAAELRSCISKFADRDIIFIDTMGRNPRDAAYINEMAELCSIDIPVEVHLLMSAASDDASMIEAYRTYKSLPIDYIDFSKLDEAVQYGSLYNLLLTYQKPVSWLTTGQHVPGDIEPATVKRLAGLITAEQ
ncbi:MAG TPA: flagellar biosynthesis protein FlhF [Nitrospirota bacterium]|nr:flagellar biosynthesis protein FlhF [Nitrospirota bacterium]